MKILNLTGTVNRDYPDVINDPGSLLLVETLRIFRDETGDDGGYIEHIIMFCDRYKHALIATLIDTGVPECEAKTIGDSITVLISEDKGLGNKLADALRREGYSVRFPKLARVK